MPRRRTERDTDGKVSIELRREAHALFIATSKVKDRVQREVASDAIEFWVMNYVSPNELKKIHASDEYKMIKKYGQEWKRHMPGAKKTKETDDRIASDKRTDDIIKAIEDNE